MKGNARPDDLLRTRPPKAGVQEENSPCPTSMSFIRPLVTLKITSQLLPPFRRKFGQALAREYGALDYGATWFADDVKEAKPQLDIAAQASSQAGDT